MTSIWYIVEYTTTDPETNNFAKLFIRFLTKVLSYLNYFGSMVFYIKFKPKKEYEIIPEEDNDDDESDNNNNDRDSDDIEKNKKDKNKFLNLDLKVNDSLNTGKQIKTKSKNKNLI